MSQVCCPKKDDTTTRMSTIMGKIMGDAYGDNRFDFYDFIPLLVVLVGSAVLVAGLFPSGFRKVGCHELRTLNLVICSEVIFLD